MYLQHDNSAHRCETESGFKIGGVTLSAIFFRFVTQDFHPFWHLKMLYMEVTSDRVRRRRRQCMSGWHSKQKTSSLEEFMPKWNTGRVK
jgi:hypothetical protein